MREQLIKTLQCLDKPTRANLRKVLPDKEWVNAFGTFSNYKIQAGLLPNQSQKQFTNHIVNNSKINLTIENDLKEYADKFKITNNARFKTVLTISDIHSTLADVFTINTFIQASIRTQPSHIVIAGDLWDFSHFSKYNHDPRGHSALDELLWVHDFLTTLRKHNLNAEITILQGNHDYRVFKHLCEQSPYFADVLDKFSNITPSKLFKLDELQINYIGSADFANYKESRVKKDSEKNFIVISDTLLVGHYPSVKKHGLPSIYGHHHRFLTTADYNYTYGSFFHVQLGAACIIDASYTEDYQHWTNGFCYTVVDSEKKRVIHDYCDTTGDIALFGGAYYYRDIQLDKIINL
jgi:predicted phosphodiesterase